MSPLRGASQRICGIKFSSSNPQIHLHTSNLCNGNLFLSFRATLYPCPDTAAERREMAIGVNTRIEDLQHVSTLYGKCLLHYKTCTPNLLIFFCFCCPVNQVSCLMAGLLCGRTNFTRVLLDHAGCLDGNLAQLALSPLSFSFNLLIC